MTQNHTRTRLLLIAALSAFWPHPAPAQEASLRHQYLFDGTVADQVGPAALFPAGGEGVTYADDAPDGRSQSVLFGSDAAQETSRLVFPDSVTLPVEAGTVAMWLKVPDYSQSSAGTTRYIMNAPGLPGRDNGITRGCFITLSGTQPDLVCQLGGGELKLANVSADLSGWMHFALTWNAERKTARVFINGDVVDTFPIESGPQANTAHPMRLGGHGTSREFDSSDTQFQGMMSDLRIYAGEIDANEARELAKPNGN
jgi:hypothetical protein